MRTVNYEKRAEKMQLIVHAALKCFEQRGFHQAGMAEICKVSNISTGAMYAYFPSKRDIIVAVAKEHMKEVYAFIDMLEVSKKPIALLIAAAQEEVSAKPDALEIEIFAEAMRNPDVMDVFKAADESFRRVLKGVFMQLGKSNVKAEALADYISSIFDGLRMRKTLNASSDSKRLVHMFEQTLDVLIA